MSATIAIFALPSAAIAQPLVPPGNSAVNQYTETFPTAGGNRDAEKGSNKGDRSPAKVLGARNARRLEARGQQGRAAAVLAAATAPSVGVTTVQGATRGADRARGDAGKPDRRAGHAADGARTPSFRASEPSGSSGLGEVIAQATGSSSSSQMGALLPLVIVGVIGWSLAYLWRQRKRRNT
ncbi:MAG: hypothetical protein FVQ78_07435 [Solirubrobacterales bacterium]|nr:hypothetical protein [Solirubrobacterales bacterium]